MAKKEVTAAEIKRLMLSNFRRYRSGEISESKAFKENVLLSNILKAIEVSEESDRISTLEQTLERLKAEEE